MGHDHTNPFDAPQHNAEVESVSDTPAVLSAHTTPGQPPRPPMTAFGTPYMTAPAVAASEPPPLPDAGDSAADIELDPLCLDRDHATAAIAIESAAAAKLSEPGTDDDSGDGKMVGRVGRGVAAMMASAFFFAAMSTTAKYLTVYHSFSPFQVTMLRGWMLLLFGTAGLARGGHMPLPRRPDGSYTNVGLNFLDGVLATIDLAMVFVAAQYLPLSEVAVLHSPLPIFSAIFGFLIVGDPISWVHFASMTLFMTGAVVSIDPTSLGSGSSGERYGDTSTGLIWMARGLAFASSIVLGARVALCRRLFSHTVSHWLLSPLWTGVGGIVVCAPVSSITQFQTTTESDQLWLIAVIALLGLCACGVQSFFGLASRYLDSVVTSLLHNVSSLFLLGFQYLIFGNAPTWFQYVGVACILAASVVVLFEQRLLRVCGAGCQTEQRNPGVLRELERLKRQESAATPVSSVADDSSPVLSTSDIELLPSTSLVHSSD